MSLRHVLASLALVPVLAAPSAAQAAMVDGPDVLPQRATVKALMDMGVDGIITNYPNHVRQIMADRGMRLPKAYGPR